MPSRKSADRQPVKFLPGQWLDTFIPGLPKAGGFTITSTPYEARPTKDTAPYLELAVQNSANPPAQWLWRPRDEILGAQIVVRVGGSFTWPLPQVNVSEIDRLVLIAGGVGIKYHVHRTQHSTFANHHLVHSFRYFHISYGCLHFHVLERFTSSMGLKLLPSWIPSGSYFCHGLWTY